MKHNLLGTPSTSPTMGGAFLKFAKGARCLTLLILALLSTNLAWGETKTIEINTTNSGVTGSYTDKTFDVDKVTFKFTQWMKNTNIQAKKSTTNSLYNVDAIPGKIKSITFVQTSTAREIKVYGGTSTKPTTEITAPTTAATMTFDFSGKEYTYFSMTTPGNACYFDKITITYEEGDTPSKTLESIAISGIPTKTAYETGESFDPAGLKVMGTYEGQTDPEEITSGITWNSTPNPLTAGTTSVSVTAKVGEITSEPYTVNGLTVNAVEGDKITLEKTGVTGSTYAAWGNSYTAPSGAVYTGRNAGGYDAIQLRSDATAEKPASGIITTTSGGNIAKVKVEWNANTANDRELEVFGSNTAYTDVADLVDNTKKGSSLGTIKKGTSTELNIDGVYEYVGVRSKSGAMYLDNITFVWEAPKTLSSIAVTTPPSKTLYKVGETFDAAGLVITGTYSDGSTKELTAEQYSLSSPEMSSIGQKTITVSATDVESVSFNIDVVALDKIEITTPPTTTEYNEGDNFDPAGMVVKGTWGTEVGKTIVEDNLTGYTITDGTNLQPSQTTVTVSYTHAGTTKTTTQGITVTAATNKYAVTFESETEEGTLTVKVGDDVITTGTELVEGVTVSLTSAPKDGYKQASTPFVVEDADDEKVSVSKNGEVYSFTMPAKAVTITAKFSPVYKINVADGIQNGTIEIQDKDGNSITETSQGSKVVVAVTPDEHYSLTSLYYIKDGEETQNVIEAKDGVYSFTMPAKAVTVYATFTEDAKYTVTFCINGINETKEDYAGVSVEFPDNPSVQGYTFMGWTTEAINGTQDNAPTFVNKEAAVYPTNNNTLYYAVFAKKSGSENYVKVTTVTDGQYLIVNEASNRAFDGNDNANGYVNVTISNSEITNPNGAAIVEIKAMDGGYSLKITNGDKADKYINGKSGSNMIEYGTTAVASTITFTDGAAKIENNSTYFCYNATSGNDRFRFYKSTTTGANYILPALFKKQEATYTNYCTTFASANMAITTAKWGTFCAPFDVAIPEDVKAYKADANGSNVTFTEVTTTIPAGTPVVVYSEEVVNKNFAGAATVNTNDCTSGVLVGVYAETTGITAAANHTNYVLQSNTQGVGFYKATSTISLKANRCYMTLPTSAGIKAFFAFDDMADGICRILNGTGKADEGIFDLSGRKLTAPRKGVNIINGVKVLVK